MRKPSAEMQIRQSANCRIDNSKGIKSPFILTPLGLSAPHPTNDHTRRSPISHFSNATISAIVDFLLALATMARMIMGILSPWHFRSSMSKKE
jgi:hypothetical protein